MTKKRNKIETKNENSGTVLRDLDLDILFCIATGTKTNSMLHAKLKRRKGKRKGKRVPKPTISHHTTKLQKIGLIKAKNLFNIKEFSLTDHGRIVVSKIMTGGEGQVLSLPVRGHGISFLCEIVRAPGDLRKRLKDPRGNWVAFYPRNREAYKQRRMGVHVIFNPRSVQFFAPEIFSPNADGAFEDALRLILKVKQFLEDVEFPGLVLGDPEHVARVTQQHYARPFDPLANEYYKTSLKEGVKLTYRSKRLGIDWSPGLPELETVDKVYAKEDLGKITDFYEAMVRGDLSWNDLDALRFQLPRHLDAVMQRLDVLDKGQVNTNQLVKHLATSTVLATAALEKNTEASTRLVETIEKKVLKPEKPKKKRKTRRIRRKADQEVLDIRRKVEETLARLQDNEAKE